MSDLDLDQLVHTPEGRLVLEVLQGRRLPILIVLQDKGELVMWYTPAVMHGMDDNPERAHAWIQYLQDHIQQLKERYPVQ